MTLPFLCLHFTADQMAVIVISPTSCEHIERQKSVSFNSIQPVPDINVVAQHLVNQWVNEIF